MASLDVFTGLLAVTAPAALPAYNSTPIAATVFAAASLATQNSAVSVVLSSSVVTSTGTSATIALGTADRRSLVNQIYASGNFTPMTLTFGGASVPVTISCLMLVHCAVAHVPRPQLEPVWRGVL